MVEESKKVTRQIQPLEEEPHYNYEDGVCEAPHESQAEFRQTATPTEHLNFDDNLCTAEPLNYSIQPGADDRFIFEPQTKAVAKTEEKKSIEKSAERFSEEPQPVRRAVLKQTAEETVFVGAMTYASSAPSSAVTVAPESFSSPSLPSFKGAVIFFGIETAPPAENATRARREREGTQPAAEPVLEMEAAAITMGPAENEAVKVSEGEEIPAVGFSLSRMLMQEVAAIYLGMPLVPLIENSLPLIVNGMTVREGAEKSVSFDGMPYTLLASETIYSPFFAALSKSGSGGSGSSQLVFNDAQGLLTFLSGDAGDVTFQQPLVVLHPAMLPMETTRIPIFTLARGGVASESERVVARAEAQGSKNNNGQQGGNGQNKKDGEPSHEFEFVDDLQLQV